MYHFACSSALAQKLAAALHARAAARHRLELPSVAPTRTTTPVPLCERSAKRRAAALLCPQAGERLCPQAGERGV